MRIGHAGVLKNAQPWSVQVFTQSFISHICRSHRLKPMHSFDRSFSMVEGGSTTSGSVVSQPPTPLLPTSPSDNRLGPPQPSLFKRSKGGALRVSTQVSITEEAAEVMSNGHHSPTTPDGAAAGGAVHSPARRRMTSGSEYSQFH